MKFNHSQFLRRLPVALVLFLPFTLSPFLSTHPASVVSDGGIENLYLPFIFKDACIPPLLVASSDEGNETAVLAGINAQRIRFGLTPLQTSAQLTQSARIHSLDMATNNLTSHTGSDGSSSKDRMLRVCYDYGYGNEIIGWGFGGDPAKMIEWWMNSPLHRSIILTSWYVDFGAGYIQNFESDAGHYWTVNFGTPRSVLETVSRPFFTCVSRAETETGGSLVITHSSKPCIKAAV